MSQSQGANAIPPHLAAQMTPEVRIFVDTLLLRIMALERAVAKLCDLIAALEGLVNHTPRNSAKPPATEHPNAKGGRGQSESPRQPVSQTFPLIDRIHRRMHLWQCGDDHEVDEYLDEHGLRRHELFRRVLPSLIEISKPGSGKHSLLENLSNLIGVVRQAPQGAGTF